MSLKNDINNLFTFHYVYIYIQSTIFTVWINKYLHSTMFIFIWD